MPYKDFSSVVRLRAWVSPELGSRVDRALKAKRFATRNELIAKAVTALLDEDDKAVQRQKK